MNALKWPFKSEYCAVLSAFMLASCDTASPKLLVEHLGMINEQPTTHGTVGYGVIATHFDRDGDGRFEECRRGNTIYFDTSGKGFASLVVEETPEYMTLSWDCDDDGILDHFAKYGPDHDYGPNLCGPGRSLISYQRIREVAPRIFSIDRIVRTKHVKVDYPQAGRWNDRIPKTEPLPR